MGGLAFYEAAVIRVCWPVHVLSLVKDRTAADILLVRPLALKEGIVKMIGIVFCLEGLAQLNELKKKKTLYGCISCRML